MTLTVEDGSIVADANSYATLEFVNDYHTERGNTAWTGSDAAKEAAIIRATEFLDYSFAWKGEIVSDDQGMRWPRKCVKDRDGREIATDAIPTPILRALAELSILSLAGALIGGSAGSTSATTGAISRVKAGSVEVAYEAVQTVSAPTPGSNALPQGAAEMIDRILHGLFVSPSRVMVPLSKA